MGWIRIHWLNQGTLYGSDKWVGSRSCMDHGSRINEEQRIKRRIMDQGLMERGELGEESWIKD